MAINLGTLYQRLFNVINKDQAGNTFTPEQLNNDLQYIQYKYLKLKYGLPEQPNAPQAFEVVQKITDDIKALKSWMGGPDLPLLRIDDKGRSQLPSDYWHPARLSYVQTYVNKCGESVTKTRVIDLVTEDERGMIMATPLIEPTLKHPIATLYDKFIQFEPLRDVYVEFVYLRKPRTPFFDYDIIQDEVVFLPSGSTHVNNSIAPQGTLSRTVELDLPDDTYEDIVNVMLADYGLAIRDQFPFQVGETRKTTGY